MFLWITSPRWVSLPGYGPVKQWIQRVLDSVQFLLVTRFHLSHICSWFYFNKNSARGLWWPFGQKVVKCLLQSEASIETSVELCICFRGKSLNVCVHRNGNEYAQCRNHLLEESHERLNTEYTGKILWEYHAQLEVSIVVPTAEHRMKKIHGTSSLIINPVSFQ